ncbi:histidine--tRNA ligase [Spirulina major CS-329]|uniref:histidine--tRNA ligase n=1 Tax=Spirulina TaxID=1154 RepID=UPI00232F5026|nr:MULTISPECIES: histidine--tRNA ligase [Spirulina]MDB9496470.1 histidine--tRNA ligase [Spirulina subsalsa CS-330]MDB9502684.1 histidine--tRNA ligase [Spirulina major CS-329]
MGTIKALRGTRDILPEEVGYWQQVEAIARSVFGNALYSEVRPPIFEQTELFARGIGEATDVVGKEMYTFTDRGDRSITLRPEFTAGVVRAFIEHKLGAKRNVQRLWYAGPVFRYERPQAGRQRQFHQIGAELIGSESPAADVEVIAVATDILQQLGLKSLQLEINSVGNQSDRTAYRAALIEFLTPHKADLDADSQDRLTRNPLRILDSKDPNTQAIVQDAPQLLDYLSDASRHHFEQVQAMLTTLGIEYRINPRLVRGLDYYTHTAFEIQSTDLGAQATVCGGGRYDGLVSELGGSATPAVGWAMGVERLILLLEQLRGEDAPMAWAQVYLVSQGDRATAQGMKLAQALRQAGLRVEFDLSGAAFKKQFKRADRSGASLCLVLGASEAEAGMVGLKWLKTQEQTQQSQADLLGSLATLKQRLAEDAMEQG